MALLKKIKGATLLETVIASVIVLIVFVVATATINNVFYSAVVNNTLVFENRVNKLYYLTLHKQFTLPFYENTPDWEISIEESNSNILLSATLKKNNMQLQHTLSDE